MRRNLQIIIALVISALIFCPSGILIGRLWETWDRFQRSDQEVRRSLALRLGTYDNWDVITLRVYCELFYAGMTQLEVREQLDKVGGYSWKWDAVLSDLAYIYFTDDNIIGLHLGEMVLRFDENDRLKWVTRYTPMGDPNPVECP